MCTRFYGDDDQPLTAIECAQDDSWWIRNGLAESRDKRRECANQEASGDAFWGHSETSHQSGEPEEDEGENRRGDHSSVPRA